MKSVVYGPVPSWRLGRSLGIDLLLPERKVCSFNCVYCQLGETRQPLIERRQFVSIEQVEESLAALDTPAVDFVTFAGMGEPTLACNLGEAIRVARRILKRPVAVLTNSSLMPMEDVRRDLAEADLVVAKIDAPTEDLFKEINRPYGGCTLDDIVRSIGLFRKGYGGRLAIQMMFIESNLPSAIEMAALARRLAPDEVQINTPLRPCPVAPLPPDKVANVKTRFAGLPNVVTVYEAARPDVTPLDLEWTLRRRPKL